MQAYGMRISDGRSDVCSPDLPCHSQGADDHSNQQARLGSLATQAGRYQDAAQAYRRLLARDGSQSRWWLGLAVALDNQGDAIAARTAYQGALDAGHLEQKAEQFVHQRLAALDRSEEHTSELQSLMRISYAVFCLKKKKQK